MKNTTIGLLAILAVCSSTFYLGDSLHAYVDDYLDASTGMQEAFRALKLG